MPRNEIKITLSANSRRLNREMTRAGKQISSFSRKSVSLLRGAGRTIGKIFGGLGGLLGGYGIYRMGRQLLSLETGLRKIAVAAEFKKPGLQMEALKKQLFELADASNKKMFTGQTPEELVTGIGAVLKRTGTEFLDFGKNAKGAIKLTRDLGKIATAAIAAPEEIGATAATLMKLMDIDPENIYRIFDILAAQGKAGAFELQDMAGLFESLLSTATMFNIKGEMGIRKFGAFLQIAKRGSGAPAEAATSVERTISNIIEKAEKIYEITNFDIFDEEERRKSGKSVLKDFDYVLREIVRRTDGDVTKLQEIFGVRAMRAINPLVKSYKQFGDFRELDDLIKKGGDGVAITKDFGIMAQDTSQKIQNLGVKLYKVLNKILTTDRIEKFGNALDKLIEKIDELVQKNEIPELVAPSQKQRLKLLKSQQEGKTPFSVQLPAWREWYSRLFGVESPRPLKLGQLNSFLPKPVQTEHTINLEVNIDQERGRTTTKVDDMNTKVNVTPLARGKF